MTGATPAEVLPPPERLAALQQGLLGWFAVTGRDLPWRATRDPWAVLLAEAMLQQTQVARVLPRYVELLARWPDAAACAEAGRGEVVRAWQGLGYHRRAVALHRAACAIVDEHDGVVPASLDALLALPGVGPYTARAVLAFAHEREVGVVDVNAARFLARCVAGRSLRPAEAQALADGVVPPGAGWAWNQAVLDLGATVCTKRSPSCGTCPVREPCRWRGRGPDPAQHSAMTTRPQSRFEGSDRQGRGRLLEALRRGPVPLADADALTGWGDVERSERVAASLVADGLAVLDGDRLTLG